MNEQNELSIIEIQELLAWSYPTALKFAQKNGRQNGSGKWLVPFALVKVIVQEQVGAALRRQAKMFVLEDARTSV